MSKCNICESCDKITEELFIGLCYICVENNPRNSLVRSRSSWDLSDMSVEEQEHSWN